ncbi:MAG: Coenzyme F420 hydrogenase/dehydrogenase, beta subunit C-terminal domain [Bacteroidaceae bacterium]|nr:Coenzyme F420 hydrogenase/dehydrogenase, beta subunit C-terminal domain [Bacteroidaceae bacterium]
MISITDPKDCCGCTACQSICPQDAISMKPDNLGFLYPVIDKSKCTECNLCSKVCSFNKNYKKNTAEEIEVYAVRHKNITEIENSRSGAMFIAITDYIIDNGGVVYGAGYKGHFVVTHKRATSKEERDEFRGSKYVQSELNGIFRSVKNDLKAGLLVCFSGTPCQTSGLRSYLEITRTDSTNLIIVDIVCHGVPSPFIWKDYLELTEKQHKGVAVSVSFRDKGDLGWTAHKESFIINDKKVVCNTYTNLFYKHIMFRHSCQVCHFTNTTRPSDITLADFWGWEKVDSDFNKDDKGASLVLLNSTKGKEIFEKIKHNIYYIKTDIDKALQPNLQQPSAVSPQRMEFESDYSQKGFKYILKKYNKARKQNKITELIHKIKWNINHRLLKR